MRNGIAALALNPLQVFERSNGNWVSAPITGVDPGNPGDSIAIDGTRILFGGSSGPWMGTLYEKSSAGVWGPTSVMLGDHRNGDIEFSGGPVDISGSRAVILSPYNEEDPPRASPSVTVYRDWGAPRRFLLQSEIRSSELAPLRYETAIRGDEIFIAGNQFVRHARLPPGAQRFLGGVRQAAAARQPHGWRGHHASSGRTIFSSCSATGTRSVRLTSSTYFGTAPACPTSTWPLWCRVTADRLATSPSAAVASWRTAEMRPAISSCLRAFSQPAPVQHTFAGVTPTGWSTSAGSAFSIVRRGVSRVLRQSDTVSPATHAAVLDASDWTNQSVQADVRLLAFGGTDNWTGLATRYRGAGNHYRVRVSNSGIVTLDARRGWEYSRRWLRLPFAIALNRPYRLRLESIGTRHRVYMNGVSVLDADDTALKSGRAALLTHRASAEFDNVVASPTPATILYADELHDLRRPDGSVVVYGYRALATGVRLARTSCSRKARWGTRRAR